jgi:hypothetical protein
MSRRSFRVLTIALVVLLLVLGVLSSQAQEPTIVNLYIVRAIGTRASARIT